jgi:iron complex outermembrane receptor protein
VVLRPSDAWRLRLGTSGELERLAIDALGGASLRARRELLRADASARFEAGQEVELGALGALERHDTRGAGDVETLYAPSGRVGLALRLSDDLRVLANAGRYLRVPTLGELHGSSATVQGNAALGPETGFNADAGLRLQQRGRALAVSTEAFAFARWADDLIAYRRSSFGVIRPYNVGRARFLGIELALAAEAFRHVRIDAAATLLDPRDVTPGRKLVSDLVPYQSRLVANGRLEAFGVLSGPVQRLAVAASSSYRASRAADPAGLVIVGESWLFGADASVMALEQKLTLRFAVDNLLDRPQTDVVGYPLPGRAWHASAELWW